MAFGFLWLMVALRASAVTVSLDYSGNSIAGMAYTAYAFEYVSYRSGVGSNPASLWQRCQPGQIPCLYAYSDEDGLKRGGQWGSQLWGTGTPFDLVTFLGDGTPPIGRYRTLTSPYDPYWYMGQASALVSASVSPEFLDQLNVGEVMGVRLLFYPQVVSYPSSAPLRMQFGSQWESFFDFDDIPTGISGKAETHVHIDAYLTNGQVQAIDEITDKPYQGAFDYVGGGDISTLHMSIEQRLVFFRQDIPEPGTGLLALSALLLLARSLRTSSDHAASVT